MRRLLPRKLTFTREGKVYVAVTIGVGFGAINTGNNLLFLVLGMMLGLIIVSGILSEIVLRGLSVKRRLPPRAEEGVIFPAELALVNNKRHNASYSVELRDEIDGKPFRRRCFFLRVAPGEERAISYKGEHHRRGQASYDGVVVSTKFPFGLFEKSRFIPLQETLLVLPGRVPVKAPVSWTETGDGDFFVDRKGLGAEYLELREMVPGDDPRRIHWRSSARTGRMMVRETTVDAIEYLEVVLDATVYDGSPAGLEDVEQNIRAAATIIRDMAARGYRIRLVTGGARVISANGSAGLNAVLEYLALLELEAPGEGELPRGELEGSILIGKGASSRGRKPVLLKVPPVLPTEVSPPARSGEAHP